MIDNHVAELENQIDDWYKENESSDIDAAVIQLIHPRIISSAYSQYRQSMFRDAVFNAITTVFDFIRERTAVDKDGEDLINHAFLNSPPKLIFSTLETDSGTNEQRGISQILKGLFQGVRNPKAHTLNIQMDKIGTLQYLVTMSLLMRRLDGAIENSTAQPLRSRNEMRGTAIDRSATTA
jgi:uncharacterized protein (TIGR02391 family)